MLSSLTTFKSHSSYFKRLLNISSFSINKGTDLAVLQQNPFAILSAVNTKTKIVLSDALFTLIAQQPQAMLLAMFIQPKIVNGKKVYEVELKDGKFSVNGSAL